MLIAIVPLMFAVAGVLVYALASSAKLAEVGRLTFLSAMVALMFEFAKHVVRIGVVVLVALAINGCGPKATATIHDTATCIETQAVKDLEPTVEAVLLTSGDVWLKLLAALESGIGADVIDCAVKAVKADLLAKQGAAPGSETAVQRADIWLNRHKSAAHDVPRGEPAVGYRMSASPSSGL